MVELVFLGILSLIVLDIVNFFINKLKMRQLNYQNSLDNFEVRMDSSAPIITIIGTLFFGFCAYWASKASIENGYYAWFGFAMTAFLSAIFTLVFFKKLKITGNNIIYIQYLFPKRIRCTFSDISHYIDTGDRLILYKDKKKLFSIDKDMTGYSNLSKRLDKENIKCSDDGITLRTIRKSDIFFRNNGVIGLAFLFIFCALVLVVTAIAQDAATKPITALIIDSIILILVMLGSFLFSISFIVVPAYINIHRIEKRLGINFDEEMAKLGVVKFNYKNKKWYIEDMSFIVNSDYILEIEKVVDKNEEGKYVYYLKNIDKKTIKLSTSNFNNDFENWFNKK